MIWVLREGALVAVVHDMATATKLLPGNLIGEWTLQLVCPPPTPQAIDSVASLLQSLKTPKISDRSGATPVSVAHLRETKGEDSLRSPENKIDEITLFPLARFEVRP